MIDATSYFSIYILFLKKLVFDSTIWSASIFPGNGSNHLHSLGHYARGWGSQLGRVCHQNLVVDG